MSMHVIVVGADATGEHLIELAIDAGHDVVLIEPDELRAEHCSQHYDAQVLHAGIGEEGILDEAGADHADALIATTDDDSVNLMAMVMGQQYEIAKLTSTVNSKHRKPLFDRLGVSTLVDPEILVARHLLNLALNPSGETVTSLGGKGQVYELALGATSELVGRTLGELDDEHLLPDESCIVLIERDDERVFPRTETRFEAEDLLLVFSVNALTRKALDLFVGDHE
jgi:trk system potassium uptake protein TrkA